MEVIVLAGGMGTRLRGIIDNIPKPMAPVNGIPFLQYILAWLKKYPVTKIVISCGYKAEAIAGYFGSSAFGIPVVYAVEEKPLGTGGAVMFALLETSDEEVLIINGDTYFPLDLNNFYAEHVGKRNLLTVALKKMKDFSRYGTVECREGTVMTFNEKKPCKEGLINGGIYLVNREYIESKQLPYSFSFEKEILEKEAGNSIVKCMTFDDPFIDIGVPEDYLRASFIMKRDENE